MAHQLDEPERKLNFFPGSLVDRNISNIVVVSWFIFVLETFTCHTNLSLFHTIPFKPLQALMLYSSTFEALLHFVV